MAIKPDQKNKVKFKKMGFKTIVQANDPKPPKAPAYEFSNGRKFYRKGEA